MLDKIRTLASLYRELGPRWAIFRVAYAFRLRTGLIRLQMPQYKWTDRPLETWLKEQQSSAGRVERAFFPFVHLHLAQAQVSRPGELPYNLPWNSQTAIDEADRILNGEIKYFAHEFVKTGFPPNWYKDYFTSHVTLSNSEGSLSTKYQTLTCTGVRRKRWPQQTLPQSDMEF